MGVAEALAAQVSHEVTSLLPDAEAFDIGGGAVAEPAIELCRVFELLAARSGDGKEAARDLGKASKIAPELFKLCDGENVFLPVTPALFHVL
jgi:hypothetical protein